MSNDNIPADFSVSNRSKGRKMEVRDFDHEPWKKRLVLEIKNGRAFAGTGPWWEQCREIPSKKMRPMTQREIMGFCRKKWPEVSLDGGDFVPFWALSFFEHKMSKYTYRLSDGTTGKFEVEK